MAIFKLFWSPLNDLVMKLPFYVHLLYTCTSYWNPVIPEFCHIFGFQTFFNPFRMMNSNWFWYIFMSIGWNMILGLTDPFSTDYSLWTSRSLDIYSSKKWYLVYTHSLCWSIIQVWILAWLTRVYEREPKIYLWVTGTSKPGDDTK